MEIKENNQNIVEYKGKKYKFIEDPNALCSDCAFCNIDDCVKVTQCLHTSRTDGKDGYFVEIKPTLILKPFNLEQAKQGKPVVTKDGHKVRIVCFDRIDTSINKPIIALVKKDGQEYVHLYDINGRRDEIEEQNLDLMMFAEKKEGWINIYVKFGENETGTQIYDTKEKAILGIDNTKKYVNTIKIEWEE